MIDLQDPNLGLIAEEAEMFEYILKNGHYEEWILVRFIKRLLLSKFHRQYLFNSDLDVYDVLNGRYDETHVLVVEDMFNNWNRKVGHKMFGT